MTYHSPPSGEQCRKSATIDLASPIRTCIGCGQRDVVQNLVRWVVESGRVVADPARRKPGRGAWLHPSSDCLQQASRRRSFERAFRMRAETGDIADQFRLVATWADPGPRPTESGLEADGHPMSTQR